MTTTTRPVRRETFSSVRAHRSSRPLVIELHSTYVRIRPKGTRTFYTVTYDQIYTIGARNAADQLRRDRAEKRSAAAKKGRQ